MINILNNAVELHNHVRILAVADGSAALGTFWDTPIGTILHGGLYIAGTLSVIFAAFKTIKLFADGSKGYFDKIKPLLFAAVFATFCVKPDLANVLINAFSGGVKAIADTIGSFVKPAA